MDLKKRKQELFDKRLKYQEIIDKINKKIEKIESFEYFNSSSSEKNDIKSDFDILDLPNIFDIY